MQPARDARRHRRVEVRRRLAVGAGRRAVAAVAAMLALSLARRPAARCRRRRCCPSSWSAVIGLTLALMMPLAIRFGVAGVIGFLVALQLLGIVVLLARALLRRMPAVRGVESAVRGSRRRERAPRGLGARSRSRPRVAGGRRALNVASSRLSVVPLPQARVLKVTPWTRRSSSTRISKALRGVRAARRLASPSRPATSPASSGRTARARRR